VVEHVFLEVCARTGDGMHLVAADLFGERKAELGGTHRAGERDHHLSAAVQLLEIAVGGIDDGGRIEMPVVVLEKCGYAGVFHRIGLRCHSCFNNASTVALNAAMPSS